MEEDKDIKTLQNLASRTRPIAEDLETAVCSIDEQLAIRNFIARYKELEEGKALTKKQSTMVLKAIKRSVEEQRTKEMKNYIKKSKVKEKIEELRNEKYDDITFKYNKIEVNGIIEVILQELLED